MNQIPVEYWIYFQLGIDIGLILLILFFLRQLRKTLLAPSQENSAAPFSPASPRLDTSALDSITSLMESAKDSSTEFERLIHEKKMLMAVLDEKIELKKREFIRILKKADAASAALENQISAAENMAGRYNIPLQFTPPESGHQNNDVSDTGNAVMELASKGLDAHGISLRLNIPIGEVELILGLKKRIGAENRDV